MLDDVAWLGSTSASNQELAPLCNLSCDGVRVRATLLSCSSAIGCNDAAVYLLDTDDSCHSDARNRGGVQRLLDLRPRVGAGLFDSLPMFFSAHLRASGYAKFSRAMTICIPAPRPLHA